MGLVKLVGEGRWRAWSHLSRLLHTATKPLTSLPPAPSSSSPSTRRCFCAVAEATGAYSGYDDYCNVGGRMYFGRRRRELETQGKVRCIPIKAYFLCTSIDLKSLLSDNAESIVPPTSRSTNYVAFRYCKSPPKESGINLKEHENIYRYMVVFQYGSAVLFNVADHEAEDYLDIVRRHATGLLPEMRRDDYAVVEKPVLTTWMQGGPDHIILKSLDTDGIRIIGSVLGQSIALDYFIHQVDHMVEEFNDINRGMEKNGTFTMERKKLFQLVGKANSSLADVIIKLGLLDRSEIAWRNANYAQILEYLREEFELTQRFGGLDFKLKFVEHNIHFLQEVLEKRRSDLLEWCVIALLSIDNLLLVYEILLEST